MCKIIMNELKKYVLLGLVMQTLISPTSEAEAGGS